MSFRKFKGTEKYLTSASLEGKVWVANFIFTRCPNICPKFTAKMGTLQDRSKAQLPALKLVSFTVDPENDTPEVLAAYGEKFHAVLAHHCKHHLRLQRAFDVKVQFGLGNAADESFHAGINRHFLGRAHG